MLRGEIWTAVWPADPEQKERPILIISNNLRNQNSRLLDVVVAKITSLERKDGSKKLVNPAEDLVIKLKKESIIRCASLYSIENATLKRKISLLALPQMRDIDVRLKVVLDIH